MIYCIVVIHMHHGVYKVYKPKGPRVQRTSTVRVLLRACGFINFVESMVHVYNCFRLGLQYNVVLLFAVCLQVFLQWQNLTIFYELKDEPWQRVTHTYYEHRCICSARNKDQKLVGRFLKIWHFYRLLITVPLKMYRKYG